MPQYDVPVNRARQILIGSQRKLVIIQNQSQNAVLIAEDETQATAGAGYILQPGESLEPKWPISGALWLISLGQPGSVYALFFSEC